MTSDFAAAVSLPDQEIDLAQASLLFARDAYPDLEPGVYLAQLDAWARIIRPVVAAGQTDPPFQPLNDLLFNQLGFAGNDVDYDDPRNSYLNDVIQRRIGLPISLSAIYLEVGWRAGLPVSGVGLPGHFIVRCDHHSRTWLIDPFHRGRILSERDCMRLVRRTTGSARPLNREMLRPVSKRAILTRMLHNLKALYLQRDSLVQARPVMQRLVELNPGSPEDTRDLGLIHFRLGTYRLAIDLLESYYTLNPRADDIESIRQVVGAARGALAKWN